MASKTSKYSSIIEHIFMQNYENGTDSVSFDRNQLINVAAKLNNFFIVISICCL